jgi:hypothetical protein
MAKYRIHVVPADVLAADAKRFGTQRLDNLLARSRLTVDRLILERYCHWFVGSDLGWRSEWGPGRYFDDGSRRRTKSFTTRASRSRPAELCGFPFSHRPK